jgi:4a-hydroxytetrahydrobiopterin dehydratase
MTVLADNDIKDKLKKLDGWKLDGNAIKKEYKRKDFVDSIGFVSKIALLAERADHHPDLLVQYNKVNITLSTHSEGGVTEKDLNLAGEIEQVK